MDSQPYVAQPLVLRLADEQVQDTFLHTLDCEALSVDGSVILKVMRGRDTGARLFLCIDSTALGNRIESVLLDKSQVRFLWNNLKEAVRTLKIDHSVVLKGVQFSLGETRKIIKALASYLEGN